MLITLGQFVLRGWSSSMEESVSQLLANKGKGVKENAKIYHLE